MAALDREYLLNLKAQATEQRQKYWDMVQGVVLCTGTPATPFADS